MSEWIEERLPRVVPASWRLREKALDGASYWQPITGLSLIVSGAKELDGKRWLHVSIAHPNRMPTWEELRDIKDWLIGREEYAVQVLPPKSKHVNIHPHCLHLFACMDGPWPLPDFTQGGGQGRQKTKNRGFRMVIDQQSLIWYNFAPRSRTWESRLCVGHK